jgi:hypothetical protein
LSVKGGIRRRDEGERRRYWGVKRIEVDFIHTYTYIYMYTHT